MTSKMPFHFLLISCPLLLCVQRSLCVNDFPIDPDTGLSFLSPEPPVFLPPDLLSVHHHHHHHHHAPFPVIQRRAFFDEALAFKVGLGLGTVGGAAGGAAAGTGVGAIGATILGKTALKTSKLVFGKYKIPIPVKLPLPIPFPLPLPLPLPLPIPIIIPKLLSIHKGFDSGYHHHHREDERARDDGYRYDRDRYESIQRDDDHKNDRKKKNVTADEEAGERKVSTTKKPAKKIVRTKKRKARTTTKKPKSATKNKSSPVLQLSKGISISFTRR